MLETLMHDEEAGEYEKYLEGQLDIQKDVN